MSEEKEGGGDSVEGPGGGGGGDGDGDSWRFGCEVFTACQCEECLCF